MKKPMLFALACVGAAFVVCAETFSYSHAGVSVTFRDDGRIVSLKETDTGRELLRDPSPWCMAVDANGRQLVPKRLMRRADGVLVFAFGDGAEVVQNVSTFDGGWVFTVERCTLTGIKSLTPAMLRPACREYVGGMASMLSDDASGVCLRAFEYEGQMGVSKDALFVRLAAPDPMAGRRVALAAGPRAGLIPKLRAMVKASGLVFSEAGGPWSLGSPETRQSYLFANLKASAADAWIDVARRAGISIMHLHCWQSGLGHNDVSTAKFPAGMPDLKAVADKIRAAGMNVSLHSLTACIDFRDSWVTPVAHSNLLATYTYSLAAPLGADSQEVVVDAKPGPLHDVVMTYTSNGNALEIGGEIISYTGIRREPPYAFTGITRGAYGTKRRDHPAGARVKYLQQRYFSFYPEPDSPLAEELATRLAGVYNAVGADMIYFDGSEGMKSAYGTAKMAARIAEKLDRSRHPPRIEMSCTHPHFWPIRSTIGAWDNVRYGAKTFEDDHLRSIGATGLKANLLETQMGWWQPQMPSREVRGRFLDETEYFAAKNAGADSAMSLQGIGANGGFIPVLQEKAVTLIGWYERFRLARAFAPDVQKELATLGREGELRQDEDGAWTYTPVTVLRHRINGAGVGDRWEETVPAAAAADIRVESFYGLSDYASPSAPKVFSPAELASAKAETAKGVTLSVRQENDPERGAVARIAAGNDSGRRRGAWARMERIFPGPGYFDMGAVAGIGLWVRGDGSGALLNVQLEHPREYSVTKADNLVKIDFKGWRYVELLFRERDVDAVNGCEWPYRISHPEYMTRLRTDHVSAVRVYLNEIPMSAGEGVLDSNAQDASARPPSLDIAISEIRALGLREGVCGDVALTLNGERVAVPFQLASGDWADLSGEVWSHFDEKGELKGRKPGPKVMLRAGANAFAYSAKVSSGSAARAEVNVFAKGTPRPALAALSADQRRQLDWEAEMPAEWAPSKGADALPPVKVRPGEEAELEVTLRGPVADPVLKVKRFFGWHEWRLESVKAGEVKRFTGGPVVSGVKALKLESSDAASAAALVEIVKRYRE